MEIGIEEFETPRISDFYTELLSRKRKKRREDVRFIIYIFSGHTMDAKPLGQ